MSQDTISKITSEFSLLVIILASLILFKTTFAKEVGTEIVTIYLSMAVLCIAIFFAVKDGIISTEIRQKKGNSVQSLLWAGGTIVGFSGLYNIVNYLFRQSIIPLSASQSALSQTAFQSMFGGLVKFAAVDFSQLTLVKFYLYGFLIPVTETLTLVSLFIFLIWVTNEQLSLKNPAIYFIITILASAFLWFHLRVRGVNNNVDLTMTFLFGFLTLMLVTHLKEFESANEFHVGTNGLALLYGR